MLLFGRYSVQLLGKLQGPFLNETEPSNAPLHPTLAGADSNILIIENLIEGAIPEPLPLPTLHLPRLDIPLLIFINEELPDLPLHKHKISLFIPHLATLVYPYAVILNLLLLLPDQVLRLDDVLGDQL
jgi:hypothetical protein